MKETDGQMCKNTTARINRLKEVTERDITYVKKKKKKKEIKKGGGFGRNRQKPPKKKIAGWLLFNYMLLLQSPCRNCRDLIV